jgi:hypothetical protein
VTRLYDLARGFFEHPSWVTPCFRPEREPDGTRTFELVAREPLATSHDAHLYREVVDGQSAQAALT